MRRLPRRLLLAALALEVLYLVLANGAALALPNWLSQHPERASVSLSAFTPFPGVVFVRDFHLRTQDRFAQWSLDVKRAVVWIDLAALKNRTFRAREVDASGVVFHLRKKLLPNEVKQTDLAALPSITGFDEVPRRDDAAYPLHPPDPDAWTIRMDGVNARASEVWVDTLRYEGTVDARGAWQLKLDGDARIAPAKVVLHGGRLLRGKTELAHALKGEVRASLRPFSSRGATPAELLEGSNGAVRLKGTLSDAGPALKALGVSPELRPNWRAAHFDTDVRLEHGVPARDSRIAAALDEAEVTVGGLRVRASADAWAKVANDGALAVTLKTRGLNLRRRGDRALADGGRIELAMATRAARLDRIERPRTVSIRVTDVRLSDARALNDVLPKPLQLEVTGGHVGVDGRFGVQLGRGVAGGHLTVRGDALALRHRGRRYTGRVKARLNVAGLRPDARAFRVDGTRVSVEDVRGANAEAPPWSAALTIEKGTVALGRREIFRGTVHTKLSHARPFFAALLDGAEIPPLARRMLTPNEVNAHAAIGLGAERVRIDGLEANVGRSAVRAVARLSGARARVAGVVSLGPLRAGISQQGEARKVKLFPGGRWYPDRVAEITGS